MRIAEGSRLLTPALSSVEEREEGRLAAVIRSPKHSAKENQDSTAGQIFPFAVVGRQGKGLKPLVFA